MDPILQAAQARRDARLVGVPPGSIERWHVITGAQRPHLPRGLTVAIIRQAACARYRLTIEELDENPGRKAQRQARAIAMYLSRTMLEKSYPELGIRFGRDHSTVITAVKRVQERMQVSGDLVQAVQDVRERAIILAGQPC